MRRLAARLPLLAGALLVGLALAESAGSAEVRGHVRTGVEGLRLADAGPVVVYLEPAKGSAGGVAALGAARVHQQQARFSPEFLVVAAGQPVAMTNDDTIYHNVFSYSRPNAFDLGLYPGGETRTVTLEHAGVVRTYCAIHESMNATIFVAPSRFFARVGPDGRFAIPEVPPGRWILRTWAERLPAAERELRVSGGGAVEVELVLGAPPDQTSAAPARKRSVSDSGTAGLTR